MLIKMLTLPKKIPTYIRADSVVSVNAHPENLMETVVCTTQMIVTSQGPRPANYSILDNADEFAVRVNRALGGYDELVQ